MNVVAHQHFDAAVAQILRVGVTLAAVADDGDGVGLDRVDGGGLLVVDLDGHGSSGGSGNGWCEGRQSSRAFGQCDLFHTLQKF